MPPAPHSVSGRASILSVIRATQLAGDLFIRLHDKFPKLSYFVVLARLDKPIGIYLLLWPTLWALWFAAKGWPGWHLFLVFSLGVAIMRSAGCVMNDIADREFDGHVKRTQARALATGALSVREAFIFMVTMLAVAFLLVLTTNLATLLLSFGALALAGLYPFMKRYTYMPQAVLGAAFAWGIPMTFTAATGSLPQLAWVLFIAAVIWTVAYDTQYAMVDRDDDIRLGLKSSAILFGDLDLIMIGVLQASFLGCMVLAGQLTTLTWPYYLGLVSAALLFAHQHWLTRERSREGCFAAFLNNHWVGAVIFVGTLAHFLLD